MFAASHRRLVRACVHEPEYAQLALPCPWEMFDDVDWMDGDMNDDRATGGVNWVALGRGRQGRPRCLSAGCPVPTPSRCPSDFIMPNPIPGHGRRKLEKGGEAKAKEKQERERDRCRSFGASQTRTDTPSWPPHIFFLRRRKAASIGESAIRG